MINSAVVGKDVSARCWTGNFQIHYCEWQLKNCEIAVKLQAVKLQIVEIANHKSCSL